MLPMSIAISLKVHDGVVLAADSASTLMLGGPNGSLGVVTVYSNANKIFNLRKGLPIRMRDIRRWQHWQFVDGDAN